MITVPSHCKQKHKTIAAPKLNICTYILSAIIHVNTTASTVCARYVAEFPSDPQRQNLTLTVHRDYRLLHWYPMGLTGTHAGSAMAR